jgi:sugar/nucleoside kinase (ribokinase family)
MNKKTNSKKIVCVGHLVYDIRDYVEKMPELDKTVFMYRPPEIGPGGSATNVALNCIKLGHNACLIANVGEDQHGKFLLKELKSKGLDIEEVKIIKGGRTGLSVILIDRTGEVMVIEDKGCIEDYREFSAKKIIQSNWLHMTGTSIKWLEKTSFIAFKNNIPISFDPGRAAARFGVEKLAKILERVDILILNKKELLALTGSASEVAAKDLSKEFNCIVVLKKGSEPVFVCGLEQKTYYVDLFKVPYVVDTLGAGDAFAAGLICSRLEGRSLYESVKMANAAAAAKIMHAGAQGMPKKKTILEHFPID